MKTVISSTAAEYLVERSRFIAQTFRLEQPDSLARLLDGVRRDWPGARHYVFAYRLAPGFERAHDDQEPQGTAGPPILELLRHREAEQTVLVVVRYFGGIKLGRAGLVRAYRAAAEQALNRTAWGRLTPGVSASCRLSYGQWDRIARWPEGTRAIVGTRFDAEVHLDVTVPADAWPVFQETANRHAKSVIAWDIVGHVTHLTPL